VACPACGAKHTLGAPRQFNLLFRTTVGPVEGAESVAYLRPETAQGAYTQYANVSAVLRGRLPLGVAQMGRSFRNEITTQHFLFRSREFDQAELQYFCHPDDADAHFSAWVDFCHSFLVDTVGLRPDRVRRRVYSGDVRKGERMERGSVVLMTLLIHRLCRTWRIMHVRRWTWSTCTRSDGASCGALRTAAISTSSATAPRPAAPSRGRTPTTPRAR
jgi:tRNA synthetase class II core domain (G, H, P, S and T)